jgi:ankyrin repeat protein
MTSLHQAAINGSAELVKLLLECGSQADVKDEQGNRALHYAALHGKLETAALLLEHGSDPNEPNSTQSETPLHLAVMSSSPMSTRLVALLISQPSIRASLGHPNRMGEKPFEVACELGKVAIVQCMLKCVDGASVGDALHRAVRNGHDEVVRILLMSGVCDIDAQSSDGASGTPLHEACRYGRFHTAKLLLECGASVAVRNSHGQLPLDVVIKQKVSFI